MSRPRRSIWALSWDDACKRPLRRHDSLSGKLESLDRGVRWFVRALAVKMRRAGLGLCPERMLPRPIAEVRKGGYRCLEPGVRALVRALDRVGCVPVWSCEGHRKWTGPPTWCDSPVLRRLTRARILWFQRPRVMLFGSLQEPSAKSSRPSDPRHLADRIERMVRRDRLLVLAVEIQITRFGCSIRRVLRADRRKFEDLSWTLVIGLGPRQMARAAKVLARTSGWYAWVEAEDASR